MRGCARTGRAIVERTGVLPSAPGLKPTRRDTHEPEDRSQRDTLARPIHGVQDPQLGWSLRQARF
jgi:hypothetical protein